MREYRIVSSSGEQQVVCGKVHSYLTNYIDIYTDNGKERYTLSYYHTIYIDGECRYEVAPRKKHKHKKKIEDYEIGKAGVISLLDQGYTQRRIKNEYGIPLQLISNIVLEGRHCI